MLGWLAGPLFVSALYATLAYRLDFIAAFALGAMSTVPLLVASWGGLKTAKPDPFARVHDPYSVEPNPKVAAIVVLVSSGVGLGLGEYMAFFSPPPALLAAQLQCTLGAVLGMGIIAGRWLAVAVQAAKGQVK